MFSRSIARLLLVLIQVPLIALPATAAWVMDYTGQLSPNFHEQRCARPVAVSYLSEADELCVTDQGLRSLRLYSGAGIFSFATGELARLSLPADAVLDGDGGFVVIDIDGERGSTLRRLDYRGEPDTLRVEAPCAHWNPEHLVRTRDGGLVAVDNQHRLLSKHNGASGALLWSRPIGIGAEESQSDLDLGRPAEAANGHLYLPSGILHRVLVLDAEGAFLESFGRFGSARGHFSAPVGLAFGPAGTVLVLDRRRHVVLLFDAAHRFLAEYGSFGGGPGQFYHPCAIAAAPDGRVFVAQGYQGRVQSFRLHDTREGAAAAGAAPGPMTSDDHRRSFHDEPRGCSPSAPERGAGHEFAKVPVLQCLPVLNPTA